MQFSNKIDDDALTDILQQQLISKEEWGSPLCWPTESSQFSQVHGQLPPFVVKEEALAQCANFSRVHSVWKILKISHLNLTFSNNCCTIKTDLSGNTVWPQVSKISKNLPKWTIFGVFDKLLSAQNVNVARFACNVEWDFSLWFVYTVPIFYTPSIQMDNFCGASMLFCAILTTSNQL